MEKPFLIVQSKYYEDISNMLLDGAISELNKNGYKHEIKDVIGSLEIPIGISMFAKKNKYAGFIALGCIIRGETFHFNIVARETARALMDLSLSLYIPIGNGVLTVDNEEQALNRADKSKKDFGGHAAKACIQLFNLNNH